jgi:deoxyribose-phosphate aldolase
MNDIKRLITAAKQAQVDESLKQLAIHCLDYTSLNETDKEDDIRVLCQQALTPKGNVAAVCLYPQFVAFAKRELASTAIQIATVVNFPTGEQSLTSVTADIKAALFAGADEIDLVFPYKAYLQGQHHAAVELVKAAKQTCGNKRLKVILETGELQQANLITEVSTACLQAGADFLKTSTGKVAVGATLEAAALMLNAIKLYQAEHQRTVGFKASGGVRSVHQTVEYLQLVRLIMGDNWVSPQTFRLGASRLLDALLA